MSMFEIDLKQYVEDNPSLVKKKTFDKHPGLFMLKYTNKVFYKNKWNNYLEYCRGLVVNSNFELVVKPFQKIYNYGIEPRAPRIPKTAQVTALRKVNGFMVAVTKYQSSAIVSTTGSLDSPYVDLAKSHIDNTNILQRIEPGYTYMFECVDESDPHIIPEKPGLYYLGRHVIEWDATIDIDNLSEHATAFNCMYPEVIEDTFENIKQAVTLANHEGFVVYSQFGTTKFKTPYYLCLKWLARNKSLSEKNVMLHKSRVSEEFYWLLDQVSKTPEFFDLDEVSRLDWIRKQYEEQTCQCVMC